MDLCQFIQFSGCFQVPKGFPYFSVDFGLQGGYAHVIEDEQKFTTYFGKVSYLVYKVSFTVCWIHLSSEKDFPHLSIVVNRKVVQL